jgi:phosphate transport system permease protein
MTEGGGPAAGLKRRHAAERRFHIYGVVAISVALAMLVLLFATIAVQGIPAFVATEIRLEVYFDPDLIDPQGGREPAALARGDYGALVRGALQARFPEVEGRRQVRALTRLMSTGASRALRAMVREDSELVGQRRTLWLPASDDVDMLRKGRIDRERVESERRLKDQELAWIDALTAGDAVRTRFNAGFFSGGDSREPELAGILGAVVGSLLTLAVTLALAFPLGVLTAVYLESFAPKNRWTDLIEVNINNLAAVPSIVFGLLGLAVFLNVFHMPRSAPIVGGLTLALMTLPTIIIAARVALGAVPPSIHDGALAVGASPMQAVFHHVLPLAMPGILTGSIIGMARALGETAPLLMIGMVAFIADVPGGFSDPASVLPVQVYLWADSPERAFAEKTSAAILVLLVFLVAMNGLAIYSRKRFERRW